MFFLSLKLASGSGFVWMTLYYVCLPCLIHIYIAEADEDAEKEPEESETESHAAEGYLITLKFG